MCLYLLANTAIWWWFVSTCWLLSLIWALQTLARNTNDARRTLGSKHHVVKCNGGIEARNTRSSDKHNIGALPIWRLLVLAGLGWVAALGPILMEHVDTLAPASTPCGVLLLCFIVFYCWCGFGLQGIAATRSEGAQIILIGYWVLLQHNVELCTNRKQRGDGKRPLPSPIWWQLGFCYHGLLYGAWFGFCRLHVV